MGRRLMNGFAERRTSESSGHRDGAEPLLTWEAASAMLPLAGRIAGDILHVEETLAQLMSEKADLDARRHELAWPNRRRRYELQKEIVACEAERQRFRAELDALR